MMLGLCGLKCRKISGPSVSYKVMASLSPQVPIHCLDLQSIFSSVAQSCPTLCNSMNRSVRSEEARLNSSHSGQSRMPSSA